jgi:lipopolysaccharide export system permease protein
MSILFRYVFRQAASALLLILSSLTGVVWIALALRQLNVVTSQGQDALMLIKMTTLAVPNLMAIIAPFALLIAVLHALNRLNSDSELIVLTASGGTIWTVARPLLVLAAIVSIGVAFIHHVAQPWSLRLLKEYVVQVRTDLLTQVIQPGRFTSPEPDLTFHIRARDTSGELRGLIMHDNRDKALSQSYLAERGLIVKQDGTAYLVMNEGHILRRAAGNEPAQIIAFDTYAFDLNRFEPQDDAGAPDLKPRERFFSELVWPEKTSRIYKNFPGQFRAELNDRFANPLYPLAFVLIALATVGRAQSTRQTRGERIVFGIIAAVGARLVGFAVNNAISINAAFVPVLYAIPLSAMALSIFFMRRNVRPRSSSMSWNSVTTAWERLVLRRSSKPPVVPRPANG